MALRRYPTTNSLAQCSSSFLKDHFEARIKVSCLPSVITVDGCDFTVASLDAACRAHSTLTVHVPLMSTTIQTETFHPSVTIARDGALSCPRSRFGFGRRKPHPSAIQSLGSRISESSQDYAPRSEYDPSTLHWMGQHPLADEPHMAGLTMCPSPFLQRPLTRFEFFTDHTLSAEDRRFILEDVTGCESFHLTQTFCDCLSYHEHTRIPGKDR
jgi:hypothetical protein